MKYLLLTLIAFVFLFGTSFETFSQGTSKQKLVKCYEKGKVVYRKKCRATKIKSDKLDVYDLTLGNPNSKYNTGSDGQGVGKAQGSGNGSGSGTGNGENTEEIIPNNPSGITGLRLISKPTPGFTDEARTQQIQGIVSLKVTFLANGNIGEITPVRELPGGLTDQAVKAAKLIKFKPAMRNGTPITVTKIIEYSFSLY